MHFLSPTTTNATNDEDGCSTMKCAQVTRFVDYNETINTVDNDDEIDDNDDAFITFTQDQHPKPKSSSLKWNEMLVQVMACSISNIDSIYLSGNSISFQRPTLPYIPGSFVCGVVEAMSEQVKGFKVGDIVVASTGTPPQFGGLAEYVILDASFAVIKPGGVDVIQAAACNSPITALQAADQINKNDRVLILGGSTGVGSAAISLVRNHIGAAFVATTTTSSQKKDTCISLGADRVIDDEEENWWEIRDFQINKFDKIIDTVGGGGDGEEIFYDKAELVLKAGVYNGHFIDATGNYPEEATTTTAPSNIPSWLGVATHYINSTRKPLWTRTRIGNHLHPVYTSLAVPPRRGDVTNLLSRILELMEEGKFKVCLDPSLPLDFTQDGISKAYEMQRRGHTCSGNSVIQISTSS